VHSSVDLAALFKDEMVAFGLETIVSISPE
jgi:hypothetical protein